MYPISHARHRFPLDIIGRAVWLYFRFTLSFRDVEYLMAERGIEASYETMSCGTRKFGGLFAGNLRKSRQTLTGRWRLDGLAVWIAGKRLKSQGSAQRFPAIHTAACNTFNVQLHLIRRSTFRHLRTGAMATWNAATVSA